MSSSAMRDASIDGAHARVRADRAPRRGCRSHRARCAKALQSRARAAARVAVERQARTRKRRAAKRAERGRGAATLEKRFVARTNGSLQAASTKASSTGCAGWRCVHAASSVLRFELARARARRSRCAIACERRAAPPRAVAHVEQQASSRPDRCGCAPRAAIHRSAPRELANARVDRAVHVLRIRSRARSVGESCRRRSRLATAPSAPQQRRAPARRQ